MSINSFAAHIGSDNQNVKMSQRIPRKSEALHDEPARVRDQPEWILNALHRKGELSWNANTINLKGKLPASCSMIRPELPELRSTDEARGPAPSPTLLSAAASPQSSALSGPSCHPDGLWPPGPRSVPQQEEARPRNCQEIKKGALWVKEGLPNSQRLLPGPSL